jgi:hypothetical protein
MDHVVEDRGDLCYLPATEALRLFRERRLSPVELMAAVIARAEVVEPYEDVGVFCAGAAYERLRPWLDAPERRPLQSTAAASPRPQS